MIQHWMSAVEVDEDSFLEDACLFVSCILFCTSTTYENLYIFNFQNILRSHPPNQVLSALQALTSRQQVALEEKIAALNVERDVSDLGYVYNVCFQNPMMLFNWLLLINQVFALNAGFVMRAIT